MPGRFRLRQGVMRGDVTPQGLPIQLVGGVRPRSLVRQTTGFEPPVHAGLTHLEPPGCLCLASTAPDKLHHPLTQI